MAGVIMSTRNAAGGGRADRDTCRSGAERSPGTGRDRHRGSHLQDPLRSSARITGESPLARADRGQVPHLCGWRVEPLHNRGDDRCGRQSGKARLGAKTDGDAARRTPPLAKRAWDSRGSPRLTEVRAGVAAMAPVAPRSSVGSLLYTRLSRSGSYPPAKRNRPQPRTYTRTFA